MSSNYAATENGIVDETTISGPHAAHDASGELYHYWRCEACGVETTDASIRDGCFRCGSEGGR